MAQAQQAGNGNEDYIINVQEVWKTYRDGRFRKCMPCSRR